MSIKGKAYIVGIYEHPTRLAQDKTVPQLHAEVAKGAIEDAGLGKNDIDGYFCAAGDTPGLGGLSIADYLGLKLRHIDSTDTGGSSYLLQVGHVAETIAAGKCSVALITLAGRPRAEGMATGTAPRTPAVPMPESGFELPYAPATANMYAMCAMRHRYEYGTTAEQMAWVKVAASHHAQYNPHAMLKDVVTVEDVVNSPMIADPLHRLDCCVISDGGGLCNNHPANRGGMTKVIEAVRQLRGEAHPAVQVRNCDLALAHGTGGSLGTRHGSATLIMERE
jgi:acetyl-CoA C-acetyltransferase